LKSRDKKGNANTADRTNSGNGMGNGKGRNGFGGAAPLYEREHWGVSFFGLGESLPGPGLYDRTDPKAKKAHEKESPRPKPGDAHAEFEVQPDRAFAPTEERCAW